jgi:hypothetical protein
MHVRDKRGGASHPEPGRRRNAMHEREVEYCRMREREERSAAAKAHDPAARDAHVMLAERYADRVWSIEEGYGRVVTG